MQDWGDNCNAYVLEPDPDSTVSQEGSKAGQRAVNGWKNAGLSWSYKLSKVKMYFPLR